MFPITPADVPRVTLTIKFKRQFFLGAGFGGPFSAMDFGPGGVAGGAQPPVKISGF